MNKKKLIIILFALIVVVAVGVSVGQRTRTPVAPTPQPTLAPPAPTGIFVQPPNVVFSFASPPAIPADLPGYMFQPASLSSVERAAAGAAPALNLGATPSTLVRGGSYTKTWSRPNEAVLAVTQTNGLISVTFRQAKTTQAPGALSPVVAVQQFLLALIPPTSNLSVRAAGTADGPFDGLLVFDAPAPTSFKNYLYSYALGGYPVLTSGFSITPASVIADSGGIIRFANIVPPPASFQQVGPSALLTVNDILASLTARRGVLLDTHNPQAPEQGEVPVFSKFVIEDSKIVYAPRDNLFLPALYMTGTGTDARGGIQKATIFLWLFQEGAASQP